MALTPPPRQSDPADAGSFFPATGSTDTPANGEGEAAPDPGSVQSPGALEDTQNILQIASAARKLAMKYSSTVPEVQEINSALQRLQMKILAVQPPSEVPAPPQ